MKKEVDVVVVGAGVVGLTAALALAQSDFSVALIDANKIAPAQLPDLRVYAVNEASQQLFQQVGAWPLMAFSGRVSPYEKMLVWDAATKEEINFDTRLIAANQLGAIMEEAVIKNALLECIQKHPAIFCYPENTITAVQLNESSLDVFSAENQWQAKLLCAADGANSVCRRLLDIPLTTWPYHQHALVATVSTELPHQKTAYQVFNADGPLAFLPLINPYECSIVWSTTAAKAQQLVLLDDEKFNQQLSEAFAGKLGKVKLLNKRHQFPLIMRHVKQYSGNNWLIMGDAAHTIHPLAGLGLNLGLADLTDFLQLISKNNKQITPGLLRAYQRQRKNEVWQNIALMEALKAIFLNPLMPVKKIRGLGLKLCNQFTPLKRLFINHARGK